jgi:hypothetical protein
MYPHALLCLAQRWHEFSVPPSKFPQGRVRNPSCHINKKFNSGFFFDPALMILESILWFSPFILPVLGTNEAGYTCRCLYGQPCWPDQNEFATLASQLSRPLLHPLPPASACYPASAPSSNCSVVIENYTNGTWPSSIPLFAMNLAYMKWRKQAFETEKSFGLFRLWGFCLKGIYLLVCLILRSSDAHHPYEKIILLSSAEISCRK